LLKVEKNYTNDKQKKAVPLGQPFFVYKMIQSVFIIKLPVGAVKSRVFEPVNQVGSRMPYQTFSVKSAIIKGKYWNPFF